MARTRSTIAGLAAAAMTLAFAGGLRAQDPPKDDALDRLLEKLEGNAKPAPAAEPAPKPKDPDKADAKKDAPKDKTAEKAKAKPAPAAEPEDKALDSLLEKLGETAEKPETTGPAGGGGKPDMPDAGGAGQPDRSKPADASADRLKEGEKPLDEHLERLAGVIRKKKDQQGEGSQGQPDDSPIGKAVKKMREVETKLGETDTGEETRKKQGEIVKDLEQLISQAKKQGQGRGRPGRRTPQQGQPGQQPGDQPGTDPNAQGAGPMKAARPESTPSLAGGKDIWGNLPAMLRDEMENVFKTEPLPSKSRQIDRYYESLSKKSLSRSGGK